MRKRHLLFTVCAWTLLMSMTAFAVPGQWVRNGIDWQYIRTDGLPLRNTGAWLDGNKDGTYEYYLFDENGDMRYRYYDQNQNYYDENGMKELNTDEVDRRDHHGILETYENPDMIHGPGAILE